MVHYKHVLLQMYWKTLPFVLFCHLPMGELKLEGEGKINHPTKELTLT